MILNSGDIECSGQILIVFRRQKQLYIQYKGLGELVPVYSLPGGIVCKGITLRRPCVDPVNIQHKASLSAFYVGGIVTEDFLKYIHDSLSVNAAGAAVRSTAVGNILCGIEYEACLMDITVT